MSIQLADATSEYEKDSNLKRADVEILLEWLKKQPHLPSITELQVILFLHSCYYGVEAAKTTIDNYFTIRTLCPEVFTSLINEDVLKFTLSVGFISILPTQTPEGYIVVTLKLLDCKPKNYDCVNLIKLMNMVMMLHLHQYGTANGVVVLMDMEGSVLGHLTKVNLMAMKQFLYYVQEGIPIRIKGLHIINVVFFADKLINMVKPFMKKELINLLTFHPESMESLYEYVPKTCLPEEYGGHLPSIRALQDQNSKNLLNNLNFFKWHDSQTVNESKRFGTAKNVNTLFGIEGTFKKLEID